MSSHELVFNREQVAGSPTPEISSDEGMGVVLMVLAVDPQTNQPMVWTQKEHGIKESTRKRAGQISLPSETRKVGEDQLANMLGAVGEFTRDDEDLSRLSLLGITRMPLTSVGYGGKPADLAVMLYEGPLEANHQPVDETETSPNGWMKTDEIQMQNGAVRELTHITLQFALEQRTLEEALERINLGGERIPLASIVGDNFSIASFVRSREQAPDVDLLQTSPSSTTSLDQGESAS